MSLFISSFIITTLILMLGFVQIFISDDKVLKLESMMPLESGFESMKSTTLVGTPFFFLAVIFVLFDLELVLLFPGVLQITSMLSWTWGLTIGIILMTLMLEWMCCGLKWQI